MDLVSIIMPNYNGSKYISLAIESILNQSYKNWELIIIDDVSNDNSIKIIETYQKKDNRIKLLKLKHNSGPAIARNTGIKEAKGDFIAFLDSDDLWIEYKLEKQINFMNKNKIALSFSSYEVIDEDNNVISTFIIPKEKITYTDLLKTNIIGNLTGIYNIKLLKKKYYMENVGHEDYTLWLKILKNIDYAYGTKCILAKYRQSSDSISRNKFKAALWQWKIYREVEKLNIFQSIYYFLNYAYYGLKKY